MSSRKINDNTETIAAIKKARKNPVEAYSVASEVFLCPRSLEITLPDPWPNKNPIACRIDIKPNTIPIAPLALFPNVPTNAVSTRL